MREFNCPDCGKLMGVYEERDSLLGLATIRVYGCEDCGIFFEFKEGK